MPFAHFVLLGTRAASSGKSAHSFQRRGTGRDSYLLIERFGFIDVALALVAVDNRLFLIPRRWSCFGMPLPGFLLPSGRTFEAESEGRFRFNAEIAAPFIGLIVAYEGTLEPGQGS